MSHNDLINEVTRQLAARFSPNPLAIKKRIEALLDVGFAHRPSFIHPLTFPHSENIWTVGRIRSRTFT
jgi:Cullin protein neddylation domain